MNKRRLLPSKSNLHALFDYNKVTGSLRWKYRPLKLFSDKRSYKIWNTRYAGKEAGCFVDKDGVRVTLGDESYAAHRIIYKMITGLEPSHIDHKNLNAADNKFSNLRPANDMTNGWNSPGRKDSKSGLKGVVHHKEIKFKKWRASVYKAGKAYSGGYFLTKEEAFLAACKLREKLHGTFARHGHS